MRRLNVKLLLILLTSAVLLGAVVHGVHAFQVRRHSGMFLREADRVAQSGHLDESADYLRRYLLLVPGDTDVVSRLAKLEFSRHRDREAQLLFSQVVHNRPSDEEARRRLVDVSLRLKEFQDAKYQLEGFLLKAHSEDGDLHLQLGSCQQALGDYDAAKLSYETAIRFAPELVSASGRLADLLVERLDGGAQAVSTLNAMIDRNPKSGQGRTVAARAAFLQSHARDPVIQSAVLGKMAGLDRTREMLRRAFADARAALEQDPHEAKTLLFAAQAALFSGSSDEARAFADRALESNPADQSGLARVLA